jgi:zinc/manganese transport system substrate-binding protein
MRMRLILGSLLLAASALASAVLPTSPTVTAVATTTSAELLLREVGGSAVTIITLAPPDQDVHSLTVKPYMVRAVHAARLVVAIGADLESNWLPQVLSAAANPSVQPGSEGYFEVAAQIPLLNAKSQISVDHTNGDEHPLGNPHIQMDPVRFADAGLALAERLARLDPAHAADFRAHAQTFKQAVNTRVLVWQRRVAGAPGAVLYHRDGDYLMSRLNLPVLAYIEPLPGMPPTATHLANLVTRLKGMRGVILHTPFQANSGITNLATQLGWKAYSLPLNPPPGATTTVYLDMIDQWVNALASAKQVWWRP